jgi:hypothetical protein
MTQEHPITPSPELVQQWWDGTHGALYEFEAVTTQAARWGADEQLEQDARWLDTCALFSTHLTITPSGDALRQAMRPKPPSLRDEVKQIIDCLVEGDCLNDEDETTLRRALEQLND